jgi:hypothetical protein
MTPEQKAKYNAKRNKEISEHLARQRANLEAIRERNRSTAKVIPKDHPLSPQIEDTTVLPNRKPIYGTPDYIPQRRITHG